MLKKQTQFFVWLALVVPMAIGIMFSLEGCGDKTVKPVDPCLNRKPLTANFEVEEDFGYVISFWKYYPTDTVASSILNFTAIDSLGSKYEWTIGGGTYNKRKFTLYFPPVFLTNNEVVDVTLTIHKKRDALCFPKDDSIKTFTKKIYFTDLCNGLYKASFYGYLQEDPANKFTITIDPCYYDHPNPDTPLYSEKVMRIDGFPQNCAGKTHIFGGGSIVTYRKFSFGGSGCYFPYGFGVIKSDKTTLILDYRAQKCPSPVGQAAPKECIEQLTHKFIGVRVE